MPDVSVDIVVGKLFLYLLWGMQVQLFGEFMSLSSVVLCILIISNKINLLILLEKKKLDHLPVTGVLLLGNLHRSTFFEVIVNASRTKEPLKFPISGSSSGCPSGRFSCWTEGQERWICEGKDPIG